MLHIVCMYTMCTTTKIVTWKMWLNVTISVLWYGKNNGSSKKQIRDLLKLLYQFLCDIYGKNKKKRSREREGAKNQDVLRVMHLAILSNMYRDCYWWPASGTQGPILFTNNPKKRKYKIKKKQQVYNECFLEQYKSIRTWHCKCHM